MTRRQIPLWGWLALPVLIPLAILAGCLFIGLASILVVPAMAFKAGMLVLCDHMKWETPGWLEHLPPN